ncbi:MAG: glycosyltransferase family 4 protein, partial [Gemmatimonadales bacterium]
MRTLLLAQDFPPMGGGIARLHGELVKRYPKGELTVSTPQDQDSTEVDAAFGGAVDRLPMSAKRTKSLPGLLLWSRRAAALAREKKISFIHCGNVTPAGYPARWVYERLDVPYGIFFHGGDLLSEQHKIRHSMFKRRSTKAILGGAAVLMANSAWTRDLALTI